MGLWSQTQCPLCMNEAVKLLWMVRCSNINCRYYHPSMSAVGDHEFHTETVSIPPDKKVSKNKLVIDYINYQGEENKYIIADIDTIRIHKEHISVCLEPENCRCTFKISKIQNYQDILKAAHGEYPVHDSTPHHSTPPSPAPASQHQGSFQPGNHAITIQYVNYADESKTFMADDRTMVKRNAHVSACITPTGTRCNFKIDNIQNMSEIQPILDRNSCLTRKERRIIEHFLLTGKKFGKVDEALAKIS